MGNSTDTEDFKPPLFSVYQTNNANIFGLLVKIHIIHTVKLEFCKIICIIHVL